RAGTIVRRLRAFVEGGDTALRVEPLAALVEEAISLGLLGAHEAGITVTTDIRQGADLVRVDRIQIQQVLVNLIRNAIQSMACAPDKRLTIATLADREGWVRISVADTGAGIDPAIRERLFDAFSTTKSDGMGLGLSICRTIVEAHGGRIWVEPTCPAGTAFHFTIPLATQDVVDG
ncbi:ATP-binding protein, partial [Sphingomonas sp. Ant20]|uniref:sensor histidine kinase n=4 Tax=unclassified Sphingomonas TaxID=196159 RepID=UPI000537D28E